MEEDTNTNEHENKEHEGGEDDEEITTEDLLEHADAKVDALISLLIKKNIITEDEFDKEYQELYE